MGQQLQRFLQRLLQLHGHRCREAAQQRQGRGFSARLTLQRQAGLLPLHHQQLFLADAALVTHQRDCDRQHQGLLLGLAWGRRRGLTQFKGQLPSGRIPLPLNRELRGTSLVIPTLEPLRIKAKGLTVFRRTINDGLHEILSGRGGSIKTAHISRHSTHEPLLPQQGVQHANQFRPFFVDRCRVEVIDRLIFSRLHRMRSRAGIFTELGVAKHRHILDAFHSCGMQIRREALIAEHGEPFLQRELETSRDR